MCGDAGKGAGQVLEQAEQRLEDGVDGGFAELDERGPRDVEDVVVRQR